jgi:three-Cys-motif partner protein
MTKDFHAEPFDAGTIKKLEIFRGYVREWLPVFLATNKGYNNVALYDFFAGPGKDSKGVKGSPLIIIEEVKGYLEDNTKPHAQGIKISLYFNDDDKGKCIELLKTVKAEEALALFGVEVESKDFGDALEAKYPVISAPHTANLIILDQSGVKHVTEDVFRKLIDCKTTDILFFTSSAIIKRFTGEKAIARYFPGISREKITELESGYIHKFVCDYYRGLIPSGKEYYLAPFSIKKDSNVYGVIFGSNSLRGLEKFLNVCWKLDPKTGEANYNIDGDTAWEGDTLFPEDNVIQKKDDFQSSLIAELRKKSLTNKELYRYCLERGFLPKHVNEILTTLRKNGKLIVSPEGSRGFYTGWDYYSGKKDKVVTFAVKE